jgi:hypothetical protein
MSVQTAIQAIRNCTTEDELRQVIEAVKLQRQFISVQNIRVLRAGDTVEFTARGRVITGEVVKVNRKNVKVRERGSFTVWNVPASMLRHVVETA